MNFIRDLLEYYPWWMVLMFGTFIVALLVIDIAYIFTRAGG